MSEAAAWRELKAAVTGYQVEGALRAAQILVREAKLAVLEEANAMAEADMLAGNPVEGAHHRAIDALRDSIEAE